MLRRHPPRLFFNRLIQSLGGTTSSADVTQSAIDAKKQKKQQQQEESGAGAAASYKIVKEAKLDTGAEGRYSDGLEAVTEETWRQQQEELYPHLKQEQQQQQQQQEQEPSSAEHKLRSGTTAATSQKEMTHHQQQHITTDWMVGAEYASIGDEFKGVEPSKFLKRIPDGFLTPRAQFDIQPQEELLADFLAVTAETYKGVDVRDPATVKVSGEDDDEESAIEIAKSKPKWLTMGGQVRAVSEFISGHLAHQVSLPVWQEVFDLKNMEMDVMFFLWVIHLHIVARRATSCNINAWSRRREVLEELVLTMFASWTHTSEEIMGRPPLSKIRNYIKDMYYVTGCNLEEALAHDGPGGDLAVLGVLVKFCPVPRPEDIPLFTYYTLVHYIRFHIALFDRITDEEFSRGNFNFFSPKDPAIFKNYGECEFDEVIRQWRADGAAATEADAADAADAAEGGAATSNASANSETFAEMMHDDGSSTTTAKKKKKTTTKQDEQK